MAIQYINTGSSANAGNGDSLRSAFVKVNNNFTYLSTASFGSAGTGYTGSQGNIGYTGSAPNLPPISVTAPAPGAVAYYSSQNAILGAARLLIDDLDGSLTISGSGVGAPALNVIQNLYTPGPIVRTSQFHENTDASNFSFLRARGTLTAPQTVQVGDEIGEISWDTYDSTGTYVVGALITTLVDQAPAPGRVPMSLRFTTHNGTDFGTRMFISSTGTVRFNRLAALGTATTIDVASSFIPSRDITYDLGSTSRQWRSLYVSSSTIYIGGAALGINTASEVTVNGNPVTGSGSPYKLVNGVYEVVLGTSGTLNLPEPANINFNDPSIRFGGATSVATNNYGFGVPGPAAGVVYNATTINLASMKLLITIEGQEDGGDGLNHTQVCEMLVVRRSGLTVNTVDSVVYGVLHTSLAPLATLTAQLSVDGRVEILAQPTNTTAIYVKVYATEVVRGD